MKKRLLQLFLIIFTISLLTLTALAQFDINKYPDCKKFMGRDKQALCSTEAAHQACVAAVKKGEWDSCWNSAKPGSQVIRADGEFAKNDLLKRGCKAVSIGVYECNEESDYNVCVGYKNYGSVTSCRNTAPNAKPKLTNESAGQHIFLIAYGETGFPLVRVMDKAGKFDDWGAFQGITGDKTAPNQAPDLCASKPGELLIYSHRSVQTYRWIIQRTWTKGNADDSEIYIESLASPNVVCRQGNRQAFFIRLDDGSVGYNWRENGAWALQFMRRFYKYDLPTLKFENLGGKIIGTPRGVDYGNARLAVFAQGTDGYIWWNRNEGGKWSGWASTGNMVMSSEAAVISRVNGEIEMFALGKDNKLYARRYNGSNFSPWFPWGGPVLASAPSVTSWGGKRLDVFARDVSGKVVHFWKDDGTPIGVPGTVETLPGNGVSSSIAAVAVDWK